MTKTLFLTSQATRGRVTAAGMLAALCLCQSACTATVSGERPSQLSPLPQAAGADTAMAQRLHALGRPDVLALGEQHDAPDHQRLQLAAVQTLSSTGQLAAVVLEMADAGHDTRALPAHATPEQVQQALAWRDSAWPWALYGPSVMAAVAARIPVYGGNLPRQRQTEVMKHPEWDTRVSPAVWAQQRDAVRDGHCDLLPPSQIGPMTRIQVARDAQLAATIQAAVVPGKTVLLLAGSQHAHKGLGVPLLLPASLTLKAVRLAAGGPRADDPTGFDTVWTTPPVPAKDYCAELRGKP